MGIQFNETLAMKFRCFSCSSRGIFFFFFLFVVLSSFRLSYSLQIHTIQHWGFKSHHKIRYSFFPFLLTFPITLSQQRLERVVRRSKDSMQLILRAFVQCASNQH